MSIYEDIMAPASAAAPGAGAATDPVQFGFDPEDFLPDPGQDLFDALWGTTTTSSSDQPTYGPGERGPAIRQEDIGGTTGGDAGRIIRAARSFIGTPYAWGGTSSSGVDCSGLVQLAFKAAGINLPRVSYQQANYGSRVNTSQLRPGDLVAWDNSPRNPGADHIAIYIGGGRIIEAPRPGGRVRIRRLGDDEGAWGVRILGGN